MLFRLPLSEHTAESLGQALSPGDCPFATLASSPLAKPATAPPTSGTNFGFEVVPSIANGMPLCPLIAPATFDSPSTTPPCRLASILKASSPSGLIVPAPVMTAKAGTVRLMAAALVPSGATRAFKLAFWMVVSRWRSLSS